MELIVKPNVQLVNPWLSHVRECMQIWFRFIFYLEKFSFSHLFFITGKKFTFLGWKSGLYLWIWWLCFCVHLRWDAISFFSLSLFTKSSFYRFQFCLVRSQRKFWTKCTRWILFTCRSYVWSGVTCGNVSWSLLKKLIKVLIKQKLLEV